jgi:hypothetical protein
LSFLWTVQLNNASGDKQQATGSIVSIYNFTTIIFDQPIKHVQMTLSKDQQAS